MRRRQAVMRDLTSQVTVFVTTIGDETNCRACLGHLDKQTVRFGRTVIDRVAPMSAAFADIWCLAFD